MSPPDVATASRQLLRALDVALREPFRRTGRIVDRLAPWIGLVLTALAYFREYMLSPERPARLAAGDGWWKWYDQGKTLEALLALRAGDLGTVHQWYPPLYAMAGAVLAAVTPHQPFLLVNLAGLLASFWLFVAVGRQLGRSPLVCVLLFLLVNAGERTVLDSWIVPWNTDLATPVELLGLLAALRVLRQPDASLRWPALFGLSVGLLPALRPSDVVGLAPAGALMLWACLGAVRSGRAGTSLRFAGAVVTGFAGGLAVTLAAHGVIWGPHASGYMVMSRQLGFDWRLIPIHWVTLVVDPRPLFADGIGLVEVWWWLVPAIAGMVAWLALWRRWLRTDRAAHGMVLAAIALHWMLYLAYRDLHPAGLWRYHNYHYFQWTLPFLASYALLWVELVLGSLWRFRPARDGRAAILGVLPVATGLLVAILSVCWRTQLSPGTIAADPITMDAPRGRVMLPHGLPGPRDVLLLPVEAAEDDIYFDEHMTLETGGRTFHHFNDFRAFPVSGGAVVIPLRSLPAAPSVLTIGPKIRLDPTGTASVRHLSTQFGLPCWAPRHIRPAACADDAPLPGLLLPQDHQLDFNGHMETGFLVPGGWSDQADGRWTLGYQSDLRFRVPPATRHEPGVVVEVEAAAFMPRGSPMVQADVFANGEKVADWHVDSTSFVALRASVPARLILPDGTLRLRISVLNARRPESYSRRSTDHRLLGLRVVALRLLPWSAESH